MPYDEQLAERVRAVMQDETGYDEKKMFGGIAFMVDGNMAVGVNKSSLMVRVDPDDYDEALTKPGAGPFDMSGKLMRGWIAVDDTVLDDDADLERWIDQGVDYARTFPLK